jgi:hypothetical protein
MAPATYSRLFANGDWRRRAVSGLPIPGEQPAKVDGKMIGSICDDQLYAALTAPSFHAGIGRAALIPAAAPANEADRWDDAEWLVTCCGVAAAELPVLKPRKPKRSAQHPHGMVILGVVMLLLAVIAAEDSNPAIRGHDDGPKKRTLVHSTLCSLYQTMRLTARCLQLSGYFPVVAGRRLVPEARHAY